MCWFYGLAFYSLPPSLLLENWWDDAQIRIKDVVYSASVLSRFQFENAHSSLANLLRSRDFFITAVYVTVKSAVDWCRWRCNQNHAWCITNIIFSILFSLTNLFIELRNHFWLLFCSNFIFFLIFAVLKKWLMYFRFIDFRPWIGTEWMLKWKSIEFRTELITLKFACNFVLLSKVEKDNSERYN